MTNYEFRMLGMRYIAMFGMIEPDASFSDAVQVAVDRAKLGFDAGIIDPEAAFDEERMAVWMAQTSGEPVERCKEAMDAPWDDSDELHSLAE